MDNSGNLQEPNIQEELQRIHKRLDSIERKLQDSKNRSWGNIWVLVPVAAIVMWGLTRILH